MNDEPSADDTAEADARPEVCQVRGGHAPLASGLEPGWLNLEVFDQGTWWLNRDGLPFRIASEMSPDYLANVVAFLEQEAGYFHAMTVRRLFLTMLNQEDASVGTEVAHLQVALHADGPEAWLEATALMRALRLALARSPGPS